ncbi:MAG TPA: hypothetical protein V6D00_01695 [Pantanalinema sp.]
MSMFNIGTRNTGPLPPLVAPPSAVPVVGPSAEPAPAPSAEDQNQVRTQTPQGVDMGPLPWDAQAEAAQGPEAAFVNTPEYRQLSEPDQATLKAFFETTIQGKGAGKADEMAGRLAQLLTQGKFASKDAFGQGLMDHLAAFNQAPLHESMSRTTSKDQVARDMVMALADPASLAQIPGSLNCAEATLEATLAYTQPADYARIAVGLATHGEAKIPGPPHGPNPDSLKVGSSGPFGMMYASNNLSATIQRAFEARVDQRQGYWNWRDGERPAGLDADQVKMLYDGIIGSDHLTMYANQGTDLMPAIKQALGHQNAVKVTMQSEEGLHSVAVTGISEKGVSIWDPATGKNETLSPAVFNSLIVRATLDSKHLDQETIRREQSSRRYTSYGEDGGYSENMRKEGGGRLGSRAQSG